MIDSTPARVRVLVVDDNHDSAEMMQILLGLMGHQVDVAHDGRSAIERVIETRPQVVLLDIGLPDINGYEVARQIRAANIAPLRLIALTGWGEEEARERGREAGFDYHLTKPADPADLEKLLSFAAV